MRRLYRNLIMALWVTLMLGLTSVEAMDITNNTWVSMGTPTYQAGSGGDVRWVFDPIQNGFMMYGGDQLRSCDDCPDGLSCCRTCDDYENGGYRRTTWFYSLPNNTWTNLVQDTSPEGQPGGRCQPAMSYDTNTNTVYFSGGPSTRGTGTQTCPTPSWCPNGTTCNTPGAACPGGGVCPAGRQYPYGQLWKWNRTTSLWEHVGPTAHPANVEDQAWTVHRWMVFDSVRNKFYIPATNGFQDLTLVMQFTIATNTWSTLASCSFPTTTCPNIIQGFTGALAGSQDEGNGGPLVYDTLTDSLILKMTDTWRFNLTTNTWSASTSTLEPTIKGYIGFTHVPPWGVSVLTGAGTNYDQTWTYDAVTDQWTQRAAFPARINGSGQNYSEFAYGYSSADNVMAIWGNDPAGTGNVYPVWVYQLQDVGGNTPPNPPTTVVATPHATNPEITVTWSGATDPDGTVAGYQIHRCDAAATGCTPTTPHPTSPTDSASPFVDTGLTPSRWYGYQIASVDNIGAASSKSTPIQYAQVAAAADTTPPTVPPSISLHVDSATQITVTYGTSTDASGILRYEIFMCSGSLTCTPTGFLANDTDGSPYIVSGLTAVTAYGFQVRAVDTPGNPSALTTPIVYATTLTPSCGGTTKNATPANYTTQLTGLVAGDTLILANDQGPYTRLSVVNLAGTLECPITIRGPLTGALPIIQGVADQNTLEIWNSSYVTLARLEIDSLHLGGDGINAKSVSHHIILEDLYIHGCGDDPTDVDDQGLVGISTNSAPTWNITIRRNTITSCGTGMYIGYPTTAPALAYLIEYNLIYNTIGYNYEHKEFTSLPTSVPGLPLTTTKTVIRYNTFGKASGGSSGANPNVRPNVTIGYTPQTGTAATLDNGYEIYGNFFYQNPDEVLFQGAGNLAVYDNLFVNSLSTSGSPALLFTPHNGDVPRVVRVFQNTIVNNNSGGIAINGGNPSFTQTAIGNAVYSGGTPISVSGTGASQTSNITGTYAAASTTLTAPFLAAGSGLDLFPLAGQLSGAAIDSSTYNTFTDYTLDFNGTVRPTNTIRGAYGAQGTNPGWDPAVTLQPDRSTADASPPTTPVLLTATAMSSTQINVAWQAASDPDSGISGYKLYYCQGVGCTTSLFILVGDVTTYPHASLPASTSYSYQVVAINGSATPLESPKSNLLSATTLAGGGGLNLPLNTWVRRNIPLYPGGINEYSKHVRLAYAPEDGLVYLWGGDYNCISYPDGLGDRCGSHSEIWSYNVATDVWTLVLGYPQMFVSGNPQGMCVAGLAWDTTRHGLWMVGGEDRGAPYSPGTLPCGLFFWNRATNTWTREGKSPTTARCTNATYVNPSIDDYDEINSLIYDAVTDALYIPDDETHEKWSMTGVVIADATVSDNFSVVTSTFADAWLQGDNNINIQSHDTLRNRIILYLPQSGQTWAWNLAAGTFTQLNTQMLAMKANWTMIYDSVNDLAVIWGGGTTFDPNLNATWVLDLTNPTAWVQRTVTGTVPPTTTHPQMTYDAGNNALVLLGGPVTGVDSHIYLLRLGVAAGDTVAPSAPTNLRVIGP